MGDPRTTKKKYKGPAHPWRKTRIEEENKLQKEYGLKNKKEIWKAVSELRRLNAQAKKLIRERGQEQAATEEKQLMGRLNKLGLLEENAHLEDVLALETKNLLDRRMQSLSYKKGLAMSMKQARQFITHGHVLVKGRKITVPSYLLTREEETNVEFNPISTIASVEHPERAKEKKRKEMKQAKLEETKETPMEVTEKELEKIEKVIGPVVEA
ncbi:MAG TPA: 30S ribosomal protein S4 [Candidatus Nanoarchaeia archaeon]|nr:30S ribosomal protein S4 [Candidatus Nanoarchaeia archaeon]